LIIDSMGWVATLIFSASYFCKDPQRLRLLQALAAAVWIVYGVAIAATPLIVANVIVAALALYSARAAGVPTT
jgi:hypothetical protein